MDTRYLLYRNVHPLQFVHLLVFCPLLPRQRAPPHIFSGENEAREMARPSLPLRDHSQFLPALQVDRAILRGGVAQKRRALVEEAQHLLLAAADVELGLHDLIELLARHAERGVAREAV